MQPLKRVLFLCEGNADRSQMAEGLLRKLGDAAFDVHSAGLEPRTVDPLAIAVMQEIGVDIANASAKHLNDYMDVQFDYVITLCDQVKNSCMSFPRDAHVIHWQCHDPSAVNGDEAMRLQAFRQARDQLTRRVNDWLAHQH